MRNRCARTHTGYVGLWNWRGVGLFTATVILLVTLVAPLSVRTVFADHPETDCGVTSLQVSRGDIPIYDSVDGAHGSLDLAPDDELVATVINPPTNGSARLKIILPFGTSRSFWTEWSELESGGVEEISFDVSDFSGWVRGSYDVEVGLFDEARQVCIVPFTVGIEGFGGVVAPVAAVATAVSTVAVVVAGAWGAQGAGANIRVQIALRRRRPKGWRRWVPLPAWWRMLTTTVLGALTGFVTAVLFQQGGQGQLESAYLIRVSLAGATVSIGIGFAWASLITFMRSPEPPPGD